MSLEEEIHAAHAAGDPGQLARLYVEGVKTLMDEGQEEAGLFLLCQAYIYALEAGDTRAVRIHKILKRHGREA